MRAFLTMFDLRTLSGSELAHCENRPIVTSVADLTLRFKQIVSCTTPRTRNRGWIGRWQASSTYQRWNLAKKKLFLCGRKMVFLLSKMTTISLVQLEPLSVCFFLLCHLHLTRHIHRVSKEKWHVPNTVPLLGVSLQKWRTLLFAETNCSRKGNAMRKLDGEVHETCRLKFWKQRKNKVKWWKIDLSENCRLSLYWKINSHFTCIIISPTPLLSWDLLCANIVGWGYLRILPNYTFECKRTNWPICEKCSVLTTVWQCCGQNCCHWILTEQCNRLTFCPFSSSRLSLDGFRRGESMWVTHLRISALLANQTFEVKRVRPWAMKNCSPLKLEVSHCLSILGLRYLAVNLELRLFHFTTLWLCIPVRFAKSLDAWNFSL